MVVTITCPVCDLPLASLATSGKGDVAKDSAIGGHVHLDDPTVLKCLNGHAWRVATMAVERVS